MFTLLIFTFVTRGVHIGNTCSPIVFVNKICLNQSHLCAELQADSIVFPRRVLCDNAQRVPMKTVLRYKLQPLVLLPQCQYYPESI